MDKLLTFEEVHPLLKPYYETLKAEMTASFQDILKAKEFWVEQDGLFAHLKPRSIGSTINDRLKARLTSAFAENKNIRIVDNGFFGILIDEKVFIRFNKMDEKFRTAIQKRKQYWAFYNQAELEGLAPDITLLWGGYIPDKGWANLLGHYLVCYKGGLNWYYDFRDIAIQQLDIEKEIKEEKRRLKLKDKKKKDRSSDSEIGKTGTENN